MNLSIICTFLCDFVYFKQSQSCTRLQMYKALKWPFFPILILHQNIENYHLSLHPIFSLFTCANHKMPLKSFSSSLANQSTSLLHCIRSNRIQSSSSYSSSIYKSLFMLCFNFFVIYFASNSIHSWNIFMNIHINPILSSHGSGISISKFANTHGFSIWRWQFA